MNFREKELYHQIHPLKLATDIGVTPIFLSFLWHHHILRALLVGFVPPVLVSAAMMIWPPDLERLKNSSLGKYVSKHMTPGIEAVRLLTLVPMAWGAWTHRLSLIGLGLLVLLLAWCNGLIFPRRDSVLTQNPSFVDVPGVRLAYDKSGLGAPVVFLHGGLLDRRQWEGQFEFFARKYCAIRYDMRSSGQSETSPSSEPFMHHEDLFHFLHALKIQHLSLVGLSNYAVALDFTIAYPTLVEKLVLVSPRLRGYEFHDPWVGTKFAAMMQSLGQQDLSGAVEVFLTIADYGLPWRQMFGRQFWTGAAMAFLGLTAFLTLSHFIGFFRFGEIALRGNEIWKWGALYGFGFIVVALEEEFHYRGYQLSTLTKGIGFWPAATALSAVFGFSHLGNSGENWLGILNASAGGLVFCLLLRRSGDLWMPIGFHASWDWTQTYFYGVPDSGHTLPGHLFGGSFFGPRWLTGGTVGPEGSILLTLLLVLFWLSISAWLPKIHHPVGA